MIRQRKANHRPKIGLFGAPLDTGNLGVSALGLSTLRGILQCRPQAEVTVFDHGRGIRRQDIHVGGETWNIRFVACAYSRRFYRLSNLQQLHFAARLGLRHVHPILRILNDLDLVLSISGGDSFSDIYGDWRFRSVVAPNRIALLLRRPLVLLPQTYGPYASQWAQKQAGEILRSADAVWARDAQSLELALEIAGEQADPNRFHLGVDVAFGLPAEPPNQSELIEALEEFCSRFSCVVGLNVSGLLYNQPGVDQSHYQLRSSYRETIRVLLDRLLEIDGVGVLLVPHVAVRGYESVDCDSAICRQIRDGLPPSSIDRIFLAPDSIGATQAKWIISQTQWFCGTRMHSCIAALSQGIPTAAIAYSDKTRGVFESVGVGESVIDPRKLEGSEVVEHILEHFRERAKSRRLLAEGLPAVRARLDKQFAAILASLA